MCPFRRQALLFGAIAFLLTCPNGLAQPQTTRLSKRIQYAIQAEVIPAYRAGNGAEVVKSLSPLMARIPLDDRIAVDDLLEQQGLPPSGEILTEMRLNFVRFGQPKGVPAPKGRELRLILTRLNEQINDTLSLRESHAAMADPLPSPATFKEFEQLFWSIHVLQNELINALQVTKTADQIRRAPGIREADLEGLPDLTVRAAEISAFSDSLAQRQLELRLSRLNHADHTLASTDDLKKKILAVYAVDFDSEVLLAYAKQRKSLPEERRPVTRPALAAEKLEQHVRETRESVLAQAADLAQKSRLYFDGLHWWFRGRYGKGSEQGGLLKSRMAIQSRDALIALMMPAQTPKPQDSTLGGQQRTPIYDRRHHYTWATDQPRFMTTTAYFH